MMAVCTVPALCWHRLVSKRSNATSAKAGWDLAADLLAEQGNKLKAAGADFLPATRERWRPCSDVQKVNALGTSPL